MAEPHKTIFVNCLGAFAFDKQYKLIDKELFNIDTAISFLQTGKVSDIKLVKNYSSAAVIGAEEVPPMQILEFFRDENYFKKFREINILFARKQIKKSFTRDQLVVQTVSVIEDTDRVANNLVKRLRDWYNLISPEINHILESNERFVKNILSKTKDEMMQELNIKKAETMGADVSKKDYEEIIKLAQQVEDLYILKDDKTLYLEGMMKEVASNIQAIAGTMIGAKLMALAGGLEKLSQYPASTVQLLGAEKALFRHIKTGAKSPKYGVLILHPLIVQARKSDGGKIARALADKISIAAKVDYFKGDFIGEKLKKELEKKFNR